MTELMLPEQPSDALTRWADTFLRIASVSANLARTPFVPASLRVYRDNGRTYDEQTTASNVAAAMLTGQELGMGPMAALRSIDVINSTPALRAIALRALLLRNGHVIWLEEATNTRAIMAGHRRGQEQHVQRITWSMDDAKQRGLTGKRNWREQPRNMLIARCTGDLARLIAADALLGVPYLVEELEDEGEIPPDAAALPAAGAPKRTARRRSAAAVSPAAQADSGPPPGAEDEPPLEDQLPPGDTQTPAPAAAAPQRAAAVRQEETLPAGTPVIDAPLPDEDNGADPDGDAVMITDRQMKALQAGFHSLGIERPQRLAMTQAIIGREVESARDLYEAEAATVIDELRLLRARAKEDEPSPDPAGEDAAADAAIQAAWEADNPPLDDDEGGAP